MTDILYSTSWREKGPWLLDFASLTELDQLLEATKNQLIAWITIKREDFIERTLADATHSQIRSDHEGFARLRYEDPTSELKILLPASRRIAVTSFGAAARMPELATEYPVGFEFTLSSGPTRVRFEINHQGATLSTSPEHSSFARETYVVLRQWALKSALPKWLRIARAGTFLWWLVWLLLTVWMLVALNPTRANPEYAAWESAVREVLKDGVQQAEVPRAVELLLRQRTTPETIPGEVSSRTFAVIYLPVIVYSLIIFLIPPCVLALGAGEQRLQTALLYRRLAQAIPALMAVNVALPWILKYLGIS